MDETTPDVIAEREYDNQEEYLAAIAACEALDLDYTVERTTTMSRDTMGNYFKTTYKLKIKEG